MERYAGVRPVLGFSRVSLVFFSFLYLGAVSGCALFVGRPVQELSYAAAAIRAAKEVQADTLAPEVFRQANEWFFKAKREYKFKNFKLAREYIEKARTYAEQAEFESLRNGGNREESATPVDTAPGRAEAPYAYPTPEGIPADVYDQRKAEEEKKKAAASPQAPSTAPSPGPSGGK